MYTFVWVQFSATRRPWGRVYWLPRRSLTGALILFWTCRGPVVMTVCIWFGTHGPISSRHIEIANLQKKVDTKTNDNNKLATSYANRKTDPLKIMLQNTAPLLLSTASTRCLQINTRYVGQKISWARTNHATYNTKQGAKHRQSVAVNTHTHTHKPPRRAIHTNIKTKQYRCWRVARGERA